MANVIYFKKGGRLCTDARYTAFLDYAFAQTDYFMLVYVFRRGSRYAAALHRYRQMLAPYLVKRRNEPYWAGTMLPFSEAVSYEVSFYRNTEEAKQVLQEASALFDWSSPKRPQDLAFFRRNRCWFYSSSAEESAALLHATERDLAFLTEHGLADPADALPEDLYFELYDEQLTTFY